ncbi:MAG TPA: hypothetical protein VK470_01135 [Bacteroidota bacterium]|nr:hypothetical protein [Bacteroidota bacterium]
MFFIALACLAASAHAQLAGTAGSFARMGFGARGMGMANAMTAVTTSEIAGYYNPAATPFQTSRTAMLSYGILSLDRSLNTLVYTQSIKPNAGVSVSIINAGVKNIDGRDGDGFHTEDYSVSENQFALSFGIRPSPKVAIGVSPKIYYSRLFKDVSSSSFGVDLGLIYTASDRLTFGLAVRDVMSKYKWDTSTLYGQQGNTTIDKFPSLRILGASYVIGNGFGLVSAEIESSNKSTTIVRLGAEANLAEIFTIRAGLDRWNLKDSKQAAPTFGFTLRTVTGDIRPALHYAYVIESYNYFAMHILSLSASL